ncbi:RabGAP/TBC [Rhizopus microsporus ATCC 52813]|uniref:RabGAP/TBC n=1 Tax=Rhizopus microsporus ATCC 52813 TaxID=1340429 RepID=A0A2G4T0W0_RHIZD|nr:RabGAP/TBC [Rhizopus microsporus ATCC 52813]PHZ14649.1 RabGAP/TBC [Rhizopus microsporus ATCC 52813]
MELDNDNFAMINDPVCSEDSSVKLLYSKSKVYVHPSNQVQDFVPGYLTIIDKISHGHYVAWTPEACIPSKDVESFVQIDFNPENKQDIHSSTLVSSLPESHQLYAFSSHVNTIQSLVINPPSFSTWYGHIVINFKDGHTSGPFWFHDDESVSTIYQKNTQGGKFAEEDEQLRWGGDEFVEVLSKSIPDPCLYIIGQEPITATSHTNNVFESAQMDPFIATLKEARWSILSTLSKVTKFSREAANHLFISQSNDLTENETVRRTMDDYDSARIFLAKWAAGLADESEKATPDERKYRHVGIWGHGWEEETALGVFEILNSDNDLSIPTHTRTGPVSSQAWNGFFDTQGKLAVGEPVVRKRIFCGGVVPEIRKEVWLFLTGVYPWDSTKEERRLIVEKKMKEYESLKSQWLNDQDYQSTPLFQDQKHRIDKDVHRTDRTLDLYAEENMENPNPSTMHSGTNKHLEILKGILLTYNVYNTTLGYVQGMSDLLSPIYAVMGEEYLAFWSFVGYMERMKSNFCTDQSGMHHQLLILDHMLQFMDPALWLLVWYKREFPWVDMLVLWEVLWTDYLTDKFYLFIALAILDKHRDYIIEYLKNFDEILKYINDLSMRIDLQDILQRAEILFYQFKQRLNAVDNKRNQLQQKLSSSTMTRQQRQEVQQDLQKLPLIDDVLRELVKQ